MLRKNAIEVSTRASEVGSAPTAFTGNVSLGYGLDSTFEIHVDPTYHQYFSELDCDGYGTEVHVKVSSPNMKNEALLVGAGYEHSPVEDALTLEFGGVTGDRFWVIGAGISGALYASIPLRSKAMPFDDYAWLFSDNYLTERKLFIKGFDPTIGIYFSPYLVLYLEDFFELGVNVIVGAAKSSSSFTMLGGLGASVKIRIFN